MRGHYGNTVGYDGSWGADNSHRAEALRVVADLAKKGWSRKPVAFGYMLGSRGTIIQAFSEGPANDPFWYAKDWYQNAIPRAGYIAWFDARDLAKPRAEHFGQVTMIAGNSVIGATKADIDRLRATFFHKRADATRRLQADVLALLRAFQQQVMSRSPTDPNRFVPAPNFRDWWQSKASPFFEYFSDYSRWATNADREFHEFQAWIDRIVALRKEAAQLGVRVPPSTSNLLDYGTSSPPAVVGYPYSGPHWYGPAPYPVGW